MERVGVFLCECGPNIKNAMDLGEIGRFASRLESVVFTSTLPLLCSEDGRAQLLKAIRDNGLTRVVVAGCSPKEHELTFRKVLREAGLNPFYIQVANIREQCAWMIRDQRRATETAKAAVQAAVSRVVHHEPLEPKQIESRPEVLVVGAGVAGMSAALALAQEGRKVYLVERLPSIGGKVGRYEDVFPNMECAPCMLDPKMDELLHHEHIETFTYSEVTEVIGFYGNFTVKVRRKARSVDAASCIGCGACSEACPVSTRNEFNEGLNERKAVYVPYPGALPNVAVVDRRICLRYQGKECDACQKACPFGSINYDEKDEERELRVGAIIFATGFDLLDPASVAGTGYGKIPEVYTSLQFERILSSTGPTGGKLVRKDGGAPKKIVFVHCVGSRDGKAREHCSSVCCSYIPKFVHLARAKVPGVATAQVFSDLCLPGKQAQRFFSETASKMGPDLIRVVHGSVEVVEGKEKGEIVVKYKNAGGSPGEVSCDMVVLAPAMVGSDAGGGMAALVDIARDKAGFFVEEHEKLAPVSTPLEGVFIAGTAQGPTDVPGAVAQGEAAAGLILSRLVPGKKLTLEEKVTAVDEEACSGCKTCIGLCPYKAITYDTARNVVKVNEALCRGCGVCVASCPSGALSARHFTDAQIFSELHGIMKPFKE